MTHPSSRDALAVGLFIGAVFYGDVFLGITVPAAILLLPLILILRARTRWSLPVGFVLLSCTAVPVLIQMLGGYGPRGKTDLVIYLPLVYAGLTMLTLAGWRVADAHLHRSLLAGGVLCTVLLAGTLLFAGPWFYFVPGQNPSRGFEREAELQALLGGESDDPTQAAMNAAIAALPPKTREVLNQLIKDVMADGVVTPDEEQAIVDFAVAAGMKPMAGEPGAPRSRAHRRRAEKPGSPWIPVSPGMRAFYDLKNRARTPLGMSNYLAVMFVFLFNVMLYQRSRWAILFVMLVLATMSRTGLGFLLISVAFWIAHRAGRLRQLIIVGGIGAFLCGLPAVLMWDQLRTLPGVESLAYRALYLDMAGEPIAAHPIAGTPRSETVRLFGYPITWHPHNSILHLLVVFGVIGTAAYARVSGGRARRIRPPRARIPLVARHNRRDGGDASLEPGRSHRVEPRIRGAARRSVRSSLCRHAGHSRRGDPRQRLSVHARGTRRVGALRADPSHQRSFHHGAW